MGEGKGEVFTGFWLGGPKGRTNGKDNIKINIKIDLRETGIDETNWIRLAQDSVRWQAFVNTEMKLRVPKKEAGYCLTSRVTISFSNNVLYNGISKTWKSHYFNINLK